MNVGELIERLNDLIRLEGDEILDMEVMAEYDYGDRCHTRALVAFADVDTVVPTETAYSDSGKAVPKPDEENFDGERIVALMRR